MIEIIGIITVFIFAIVVSALIVDTALEHRYERKQLKQRLEHLERRLHEQELHD